jgi:hypothetical protein
MVNSKFKFKYLYSKKIICSSLTYKKKLLKTNKTDGNEIILLVYYVI